MKVIRSKMFETNSSSMHSIIIMNTDEKLDVEENVSHWGEHAWRIKNSRDLEFDRWPFQVLTTFFDKTRYVIASLHNVDEIVEIIKKYIPDFEYIKLPKGESSVYVGKNNRVYYGDEVDYCHDLNWEKKKVKDTGEIVSRDLNLKYEYDYTGYVDCQSEDLIEDFLKEKNISLEEFLINDKYKIVIDGDEYWELEKLIKAGIVKPTEIYPSKDRYYYDPEEDEE